MILEKEMLTHVYHNIVEIEVSATTDELCSIHTEKACEEREWKLGCTVISPNSAPSHK
jgi:hypothetical protein